MIVPSVGWHECPAV